MEIELVETRNQIIIEEAHYEMVRLRHIQGLFAEYDIKIHGNNDNVFRIETDDEIARQYIESSKKKIQDYFERLFRNEISISGMNAFIANNKFHAVDSKPICYQLSIIQCLNNLIKRSTTRRTVQEPKLEGMHYSLKPHNDQIKLNNVDFDCYHLPQCLITHDHSVAIKENYSLEIKGSRYKILIESKSKHYSSSARRQIGIWFRKDEFTAGTRINLYETLRLIKTDFERAGKNLCGFMVYLYKHNHEGKDNASDFFLNFEWSIRNLLSNKTSTEIMKE